MKLSSEYMLSNVIKGSVYVNNLSLKTYHCHLFVELGWLVGDGGDWHHDQIQVDAGLVPRNVSHGSAGVVELCVDVPLARSGFAWYMRCLMSLCSIGGSTILLGLIHCRFVLVFGIVIVVTIPLSRIGYLTYAENNPMSKIQKEKWADGNSVWYCLFTSQTMHFMWFIILHTNIKRHIYREVVTSFQV